MLSAETKAPAKGKGKPARDPTFWSRWITAAKKDGNAVSVYGAWTRFEDFAESYILALTGGIDAFTTRFPNRAAILAPLLTPRAAAPQKRPDSPRLPPRSFLLSSSK